MLFWVLAALLTTSVIAYLVRPLLSARVGEADMLARAQAFRGVLEALERDEKAGLIPDAEKDSARAEIARALIAEVEGVPAAEGASVAQAGAQERGLALFVAAFVALGALTIYLANGAPDLAAAVRVPVTRHTDFASLVEELKRKVAERPDDPQGQRFLGRGLSELGRYAEAADAYRRALGLGEDEAALHADFGEALALAAQHVTPQAKAAFEEALARDKSEPRARYYLALAKREAGDLEGALADWQALFAQSPPDAPWRTVLARNIAATRQALAAQGQGEEITIPPAP